MFVSARFACVHVECCESSFLSFVPAADDELVKAVELDELRHTYRFQLGAVVLAVQYVPLHPCEQPYRGYAVR